MENGLITMCLYVPCVRSDQQQIYTVIFTKYITYKVTPLSSNNILLFVCSGQHLRIVIVN